MMEGKAASYELRAELTEADQARAQDAGVQACLMPPQAEVQDAATQTPDPPRVTSQEAQVQEGDSDQTKDPSATQEKPPESAAAHTPPMDAIEGTESRVVGTGEVPTVVPTQTEGDPPEIPTGLNRQTTQDLPLSELPDSEPMSLDPPPPPRIATRDDRAW